ncbi:multifunctional 2',3'-cyclic-nucleotide 2'-phosphodiesterase/5'-nucleotidase/3'-nucleotidase [Alkalispirochaeta sphaeroplastigenens]|uniref:Multifunctional 2',3'-cyclic-nucleotide 2'-phosphodiesterase/5'-nucleotidase/3'-nucleotidase n=1 Tax=Alkalispirochaeta sphaeroplastigenens TaxID=1187066 RepID=A0A2S4JU46_9SPIO|nr:5'-nucleotidase C-terminal domain-containing protein [Alkalispirochaeta sphaeroplastigenens]POR03044.1 multifunctional 2',3'-cyclic-nucleotide 2'-phosphodiesterase/5'-nucleotidase/3'-nucleotidase [Alkalispirochaeta sphaeroplastigenens]
MIRQKKNAARLLTLALVLATAFSLVMCGTAPEPREPASGSFTILHTNDMHGRIEAGRFDGMGLDRLAALIEAQRQEKGAVLLLDAGDTVHGLPITSIERGASMVEVMNLIGYDAMVAGNHEFNYGQERLLELAELAEFPILAANITVDADGSSFLPEYVIKEAGGVTVAIFGLATPETLWKSHPAGHRGLTFGHPIEASQRMVAHLQGRADVIVALAHLGFEGDYDSRLVAEAVPGIDIIVDGHSHDLLPEGYRVGNTLIVQAEEYNKNLGVVDIVVEDGVVVSATASLITTEEAQNVEPHPGVVALIETIKERQGGLLEQVVGSTEVHLDGERGSVRLRETALANLMLDSMRDAADSDLAFSNGGGIRASIPTGEITRGQVIQVLPFGNQVVSLELTGEQILEVLEIGVAAYPEAAGAFMHWSGLTFSYDPSLPAGERVDPAGVRVNGEALDLSKTYSAATNDFLHAGGDGLGLLVGLDYSSFGSMDEVLAEYIAANSPVAPEIEGRITVIGE